MGHYLSEPITEKESISGTADPSLRLTYSACSMQGWRRTMEDALTVDVKLPQGEGLFGVFDGHGGKEVAEFCSREIVGVLTSLESYRLKDYETSLRDCFIKLDSQLGNPEGQNKIIEISKQIQEKQRQTGNGELSGGDASDETLRKIPLNVGSTACVLLITPTEIYCANVGDSRAIITQGTNVYDLSDDHKPDNEDELIRIEAAGCDVTDGRVAGKLSLSRAIGDLAYKQNASLGIEAQAITCVPDITKRVRTDEDTFIIVACDGIWDVLTSQEGSQLTSEIISERQSNTAPHKVLEELFDNIICEDIEDPEEIVGGSDNMTAILVEFQRN